MDPFDGTFFDLKSFLIDFTGLSYYKDKDDDLRQKVDRKMKQLNIPGYSDLLRFFKLDQGAKALDELISELTIGETYFFRDKESFQGLTDIILPALIQKNHHLRRLRIWSAGCATGEEAYSVLILLKDRFGHLIQDWDIQIIGTDINRSFLADALEGRYRRWSFRETPDSIIENCFIQKKDFFYIKPAYQGNVSFQYHNLIKNPIPSLFHNLLGFDLVLCRNVMIYFDTETIRGLIRRFEKCLVPEGWLLVGHADHDPSAFKNFDVVNAGGAIFYQHKENRTEHLVTTTGDWFSDHVVPVFEPGCFNEPDPFVPGLVESALPYEAMVDAGGNTAKTPQVQHNSGQETLSIEIETLVDLANQGHLEQAHLLCERLKITAPLDPLPYFYQGLVYEQGGKIKEAQEAFRKAIYLERKFVLAHFHLGILMQNTHDRQLAQKYFNNVLELLSQYDPRHTFRFADHITAAQLAKITEFHLEVLK